MSVNMVVHDVTQLLLNRTFNEFEFEGGMQGLYAGKIKNSKLRTYAGLTYLDMDVLFSHTRTSGQLTYCLDAVSMYNCSKNTLSLMMVNFVVEPGGFANMVKLVLT
ncbi:hypothetical protein D3C71_1257550 [compost metagenome]